MTRSNPAFSTTHWTLVWNAAAEESTSGRPALAEIIRRYWYPLYCFARQRGLSDVDAEDATQEFLTGFMNGQLLSIADPAKGKFRHFLLTCWRRFLVDQFRKQGTEKRGGSLAMVSLDIHAGEELWLEVKSREPDPDRVFMLSWAKGLLAETRRRVQSQYQLRGRRSLFEGLIEHVVEPLQAEQYAAIASKLQTSPNAVKVAMHRLRRTFGETLREVVLETLDDAVDIDGELQELLQILKLQSGSHRVQGDTGSS